MRTFKLEETIDIPENVQVDLLGNKLKVKGPKGELIRSFEYPNIKILIEDGKIKLVCYFATRRDKRVFNTWVKHIKNMIKGVTEGFTFKLKAVYVHFPLKMKVQGNQFIVENFLGEKSPRVVELPDDVTVKVDGDYVIVESYDIEKAGNVAGILEQLTRVKGKDPRKFQDGIYIVEKPYYKYI